MKKIQIHQFSPSAHPGDGITNGMFYLQNILHELGFVSKIYAESFEPELDDRVSHYTKIDKKDKNQILFVHYSIYYDLDAFINKLDIKKIMIYHNITPYKFFQTGSYLYNLCKKGKEYLPELSMKYEGSIGDSQLNSDELLQHDFKNVETIPLLMDTQKIINSPWNNKLFDEKVENFNIIFIGRIAQNKAQHDLIEIANIYKDMCDDFKMYIIGGTTDLDYKNELEELILSYNLQENIIMTGKVSDEDLYAYYRSANLFLCMSEHEGFGIPLIESMFFDIPVMAYNSSNIKSTLNGGGILVNEKSPQHIAATIQLLRENHAFKREILDTQKKARQIYNHDVIVNKLVEYLKFFNVSCEYQNKIKKQQIKYQFEGPFDSSYSLAMLNRYSATAFEKKYSDNVSLLSTEGGGDFIPNKDFLAKNPDIKVMYEKSQKAMQCEVVLRNLYPPRVTGMKGNINILNSFGWEESGFLREYVDNFNENLDGITVMSEYVKDVLKNNGVKTPVKVVGLGAEHILQATPKAVKLNTQKSFKFLHISSCFPRKGIDVLLDAYAQAFNKNDDVTLIIKTFPNPHNSIDQQIKSIKQTYLDAPQIILINKDLDDSHISWLYQNSDALVAPSFGEGFGLPMAEAMLFHLPVITTGYGGQVDFCTNETSWLIDYSYEKANTHLNLFNSYWVKPDVDDLKRLLKEQVSLPLVQKELKTKKAYDLVSKHFTWETYRQKTDTFIQEIKNQNIFDTDIKKIGWISSYNTKCGIATYSEFILTQLDLDEFNIIKFASYSDDIIDEAKEIEVIRCWENRFDADNKLLIDEVIDQNLQTVVLNFNFGFFSMPNLQTMIEAFSLKDIKIIIIFHSVADVTIKGLESSLSTIKDSLKKVDNLLVHNIDDLNFLKILGLSNLTLFPHGVQNRQSENLQNNHENFIISSYGFLLPHKGILELIEAFAMVEKTLPNAKLLLVNSLYPAKESKEYYDICISKIEELQLSQKIQIQTAFLSDEESFKLLDTAHLLVMPYRKTNESASGAIRYAVSTLKPVLCTPQPIFNDVKDIVHFMSGYSSSNMAKDILKLANNEALLNSNLKKQEQWIQEHDWKSIAKKLQNLLLN